MTIQEAAQQALDVQNASNLSGVVRSFARITEVLWDECRKQSKGSDFVNHHPVSVLFASKIASLVGGFFDGQLRFNHAYEECEKLAKGEETSYCNG